MRYRFSLLLFFFPVFCGAQLFPDPAMSALLSAQLEQLIQLNATEQMSNMNFLTELVPRTQQAIDIAGKALETSKRIYRMGEALAEYGPEALVRMAKDDLCVSFPAACPAAGIALQAMDDIAVVGHGNVSFFNYKKGLNTKTASFIKDLAAGSLKTYIAPALAKYIGPDGIGEAEEVFFAAIAKSGLYKDLARSNLSASYIGAEAQRFLSDVVDTKNLVARGQSLMVGIAQQQSRDLRDLALSAKRQAIGEELSLDRIQQGDRELIDAVERTAADKKVQDRFRELWK